MPSTLSSNATYMNGAPSVYDPNLDTARLGLQTANFGVNTNVPYRGLASSLNGQAGTTFGRTNFQASDIYQGGMSAPQTPVSMNGFVGNQMSSISFPSQDYSGFTGTVTSSSWLSPATPGTSPSDTAYSSAAFSPQRTPHSPYIPASSAIPGGGQNDFLSAGWRPQRRTPSTSPAPSNDVASACLQGTGGSIASSTRSSPMMGPSNPDAMSLQAGFESLEFLGFPASQIGGSQPFLNANAATEPARPPVSTNEMQPLASSKSDLASEVADLTEKVESLTSENSALKGQLATLRDQQQKSDERSQATQEELTEHRRYMDKINGRIMRDMRDIRGVRASGQTMTAATHVSGQQEAPDDLTS